MLKPCLVRCWTEAPDVAMVCKALELKSLLDGLPRHLVVILGLPYGPHHEFVDGKVGGRHSIVFVTVPKFFEHLIHL